jgi:hypothetical protein
MMPNPTRDLDDKDDDLSVHQSIPTLGDERILLEIPKLEEQFEDLPTLEELEREEISQSELDQTTHDISSAEQTLEPIQNNKITEESLEPIKNNKQSKLVFSDVERGDEEIEQIISSISGMLSKHKDYLLK